MTKKTTKSAGRETVVRITPPKVARVKVAIEGIRPYCQLKLGEKIMKGLKKKHEEGGTKARKKPGKRDFDEDYKRAFHRSEEGWAGIPATAIRAAMARAAKGAGFTIVDTRTAVFVVGDGVDAETGQDLVKIIGKPEPWITHVRNTTGVVDLRIRPLWRKWKARFDIEFNEEIFSAEDVLNLLNRAGMFVGIGEGRPDSKKSGGINLGRFRVAEE